MLFWQDPDKNAYRKEKSQMDFEGLIYLFDTYFI